MARTSQLTVGGDSCGACAASYVVEDLLNMSSFSFHDIEDVWADIAFDPGAGRANLRSGRQLSVGGFPIPDIECEHTDPTKLAYFLRTYGRLYAKPYIMPSSPLNALLGILAHPNDVVKGANCMCLLPSAPDWRAIGIFRGPAGLHYMAVRADAGGYYYIDSNEANPDWTPVAPAANSVSRINIFVFQTAAVLVHR